MKLKKEKEAIGKIKRNPKFFYKYANKFSKTRSKVGPLINKEGEYIKDPFLMSEILRRQYESTFSSPDTEVNIENLDLDDFFKVFDEVAENNEEAEEEGEPTAKEDSEIENLPGQVEEEERQENKKIEEQMLTDVPCDYMDIGHC